MSEETRYTERDVLAAQQRAFVSGYTLAKTGGFSPSTDAEALKAARTLFPLPKVTRPRVIKDPDMHWEYRVLDGDIQFRLPPHGEWNKVHHVHGVAAGITNARILALADLLAHPTEEVEE